MTEVSVCEKMVLAITIAMEVPRFWKKMRQARAIGYWAGRTAFCVAMIA